MAKRACVLCGEMAGSWSLCYITLCGTSQTLCEKCMRRYRDAAGEIFKLRDEDVAFGPPSARSQGQKNAFHRHKRPGGRVAARADELAE